MFETGGTEFHVRPAGLRRYAIRLEHEYAMVLVSDSMKLPPLWVQFRAEYLHAVEPRRAVEWVSLTLGAGFGDIVWTVSRVDLFADEQGWEVSEADRQRVVCRARECHVWERDGRLTGFTFGVRKSGITAKIYDKIEEISRKGGLYWYAIWGQRFDPAQKVWRLEFEFHRTVLRQFGVSTPSEVLSALGDLWSYGARQWLRVCEPTDDATKSRWPDAPEWMKLQQADLGVAPIGIARVREARNRSSLDRAEQRVATSLVLLGALHGARTLGDVILEVPDAVQSYQWRTGRDFEVLLDRKRQELAF